MTATAPVVVSITFDKTSYNPGDTITATLTYTPGMSVVTHNFTGSLLDTTTQLTGDLVAQFSVNQPDPTTVGAADDGNHAWVKVSDTGTVATFQAPA